jgi:serine protease Do
MLKNISRIIGFLALGMMGGIFADQVLCPYFIEGPFFQKYGISQPVYVTERKEIYIQENTALENAVEKVENTVIGIRSKNSDGKTLEGSGLIITSDGLVIASAELVTQGSTTHFYIDGKAVSHQILKKDAKLNLALVKLEKNNLPVAGFADVEKLKLGQRVFSLGIVFASSSPQVIVDEGIIKNFNSDYIETNIAESEDTKSSFLFDIEGNIVGLNKTDKDGNLITVPISTIRRFAGF